MNRASSERSPAVEWPTVGLVVFIYAAWVAIGLWLWPSLPVVALALMAVLGALHASLVHEAVHGHPTRSLVVNEALVFWPLTLVWPYRRFRTLHLRHHRADRITDAREDPESAYVTRAQHAAMTGPMRALRVANNTLAGRLLIGPLLDVSSLVAGDLRRVREGDVAVREAWLLHAAGVAAVLGVVELAFGIPAWLYALTVAWGGLGIISIRSFAEHRWHERPEARTIIVERSPLGIVFLNNNLHLVHHTHPGAPWYTLPALYRARRAEWAEMNGGYVVPGYAALARAYAFRAKEPVVHPAEGDARAGPSSSRRLA